MADPDTPIEDDVVKLVVDKEGLVQVYSAKGKKWKPKWGVLSGGGKCV